MGKGVGTQDVGTQTGKVIYLSADGRPEYKVGGITIDWAAVAAVGADTVIPIEGTTILNGKKYLRYGQVLARNVQKEVQVLTITGGPTGGTFTVTVTRNGLVKTTAAIAYNATAAAVQAALEALDNVQPGDLTVTGGPGPATPFTITWHVAEDVAQPTATGSFTGGTTPAITPSTTTQGIATQGKFFPAINSTPLVRGHTIVLNFTVQEDEPMSNHNGGPMIGGKFWRERLMVSDVSGVATQPSLANVLAACPLLEPVVD
jgi:hypothetical protein